MNVLRTLVTTLGVISLTAPALAETPPRKPTMSPSKPVARPTARPTGSPALRTDLPRAAQQLKKIPFLDKKAVLAAAMAKLPANRRLTSGSVPVTYEVTLANRPRGTSVGVYGAAWLTLGEYGEGTTLIYTTASQVFEPRGDRVDVKFPVRRAQINVVDCIASTVRLPVHHLLEMVAEDGDNDNWVRIEARNMGTLLNDSSRLMTTFQSDEEGTARISMQAFSPSGRSESWAFGGCRITSFSY